MINRKINPKHLFYILMIWFLITSILAGIMTSGLSFKGILYGVDTNDSFMDFFNPINHAAGLNPYTAVDRIYPAFVYIGYYLIGLFIPEAINNGSGLQIRASQNGRFVFAIYMVLTVALLIYLIKKLLDEKRRENTLFIFTLLLSSPFIFLYERGNVIIVALIFSMLFFICKDSENRIVRELSLLFLAISACIKIYPAVYGLVLLKEKRYKEGARCALYGLLLFVLPFAYMGGLDKIGVMLESLMLGATNTIKQGFGYKVNVSNTVAILSALINGVYAETVITFGVNLSYVILGFSIFAAWFSKSEWRRLAILSILMAIIPGFSFMYALIFMAIPLIFFFKEKKFRGIDYIYVLLFVGIFGCFGFEHFKFLEDIKGFIPVYMATYVQSIAISIMILLLIFDGIRDFICQYVVKRDKIFGFDFSTVGKRIGLVITNVKNAIIKNRIIIKLRALSLQDWFIFIFGMVTISIVAIGVLRGKSIFAGIVRIPSQDTFMEFFDSLHQSGELRPYEFGGVKPPLYYVIFGIIKAIIPYGYVAEGGMILKYNQISWIVFILIFSIIIVALFYMIIKNIEGNSFRKPVIALLLLVSAPMVFTFENGSMFSVVLLLLLTYMVLMDANKWWKKEIGILALAIAGGLYIGIAFFVLIFIIEKKYKDLVKYVLYSCVLWETSFIIVGGAPALGGFFNNLNIAYSNSLLADTSFKVGISNLYKICNAFGGYESIGINIVGILLSNILMISLFIASFGLAKKWKKYLAVMLIIVGMPVGAPSSILIFTIPAFILFINEEKKVSACNILYFIGFLLIYISFAFGSHWFVGYSGCSDLSFNCLIDNIVVGVMTLVLMYEGFREIINNNKIEKGLD